MCEAFACNILLEKECSTSVSNSKSASGIDHTNNGYSKCAATTPVGSVRGYITTDKSESSRRVIGRLHNIQGLLPAVRRQARPFILHGTPQAPLLVPWLAIVVEGM